MNLSAAELRHISRLIDSGRPIWGMLVANEYLCGSDPLFKALATAASKKLGERKLEGRVADITLKALRGEGQRLQPEKRRILSLAEPPIAFAKKPIKIPQPQSPETRRALFNHKERQADRNERRYSSSTILSSFLRINARS